MRRTEIVEMKKQKTEMPKTSNGYQLSVGRRGAFGAFSGLNLSSNVTSFDH